MSGWNMQQRVDAGRFTLLAALGSALVLVSGCASDEAHTSEDAMGTQAAAESPTVRYGTPLAVPGGTVRTYLLEEGDRTLEVGIAIDEGVMDHLPDVEDPLMTILPDGHALIEWELDLPEGNPTPFRHATLDWNPMGHAPPGVYDVPHFDVHFYTITSRERDAILPGGPEFETAATHHPSPEFVPAGYIDPGMPAVPRMGVHWIDPTSPELHPETPEPFTRTFIYGTWDGRLIFAEPMVATDWLATRPDETIPVPVAERYEPGGLWPAAYRVYWDEATSQYRIALAELAHR